MLVELSRQGLEALVQGRSPNFNIFNHPLVKKAGHSYSDQYGRTDWNSLDKLSEEELYLLSRICHNSWLKTGSAEDAVVNVEGFEKERASLYANSAELMSLKQSITQSGLFAYGPTREDISFHDKVVFSIAKLKDLIEDWKRGVV